MTIEKFYAEIGGDFEGVVERLRKKERIRKFVLQFPDDQSFERLVCSLKEEKDEEAFRAAHTLKGLCLNFGFTALGKIVCAATEALRRGDPAKARNSIPQMTDEYLKLISAIRRLSRECDV